MIDSLNGKTISSASMDGGCVTLSFTDGTRVRFGIKPTLTLAPATPAPAASAEVNNKLPPTVLGVSGINDTTFGGAGAPSPAWVFLVNHPPFQMFVAAQIGTESEPDAVLRCIGYVQVHMAKEELTELLDQYFSWFRGKDCWPNESPMGELLEQ